MYILHDSSLVVCFLNISALRCSCKGKSCNLSSSFSPVVREVAGVLDQRGEENVPALSLRYRSNLSVLAFAATPDGAGSHLARFGGKMAILSKYMLNFEKIRMDYSCHGIFRGMCLGLPVILREKWADRSRKYKHLELRWSQSGVCK